MLKQWKAWLYPALLIPSTLILCVHAYNAAYTRFISDDYCSAYLAERLGLLRYIWYWYINWGGRYSAIASDSILVWTGTGKVGLAIITLGLLLWGGALAALIFGLQPKSSQLKSKLWDSLCAGVILLFVLLLLTPNVPQSLYWWNGFRTHSLPLIGFTIYLAIYLWISSRGPNKSITLAAISLGFLLAVVNAGFSETFALAQVIFLGFLIAWLFLTKKLDVRRPGFAYLAAGLAGALLAIIIIVIAPGNKLRQSYYTPGPGIITILQISFSGYFALLRSIFTTPEKIIALAGAFIGSIWLGKQTQPEQAPQNWEAPVILMAGFLFVFVCFPPAAFGTNDIPPERAQIIPVFFLILSFVGAGLLLGNRWAGQPSAPARVWQAGSWLLIMAAILLMVAAGINAKSLLDTNAKYVKYAHAWDQNEQKIFDALSAGQSTVVIHSVRNWAGLNDPGDNPKFYVNYCMSKYYNINILADNTGMQLPEP